MALLNQNKFSRNTILQTNQVIRYKEKPQINHQFNNSYICMLIKKKIPINLIKMKN